MELDVWISLDAEDMTAWKGGDWAKDVGGDELPNDLYYQEF